MAHHTSGIRSATFLIIGSMFLVVLFAACGGPSSTSAQTLNTWCSSLKKGDYKTAYNQYSTELQPKLATEAQFTAAYTSFGKVTDCTVNKVDDTAGTGMVTETFDNGGSLIYDFTLIDENNSQKINSQKPHSTPFLTLINYCSALAGQNYQTAYNQTSSGVQSNQTEAQFAANFNSTKINSCTISNVDEQAGTGTISYTGSGSNGNSQTLDYTLVNEKGTWKIDSEKAH